MEGALTAAVNFSCLRLVSGLEAFDQSAKLTVQVPPRCNPCRTAPCNNFRAHPLLQRPRLFRLIDAVVVTFFSRVFSLMS